jgi:hypothetical protein
MCLLSRCLAINVYSDFIIPTFARHVTILSGPTNIRPIVSKINYEEEIDLKDNGLADCRVLSITTIIINSMKKITASKVDSRSDKRT